VCAPGLTDPLIHAEVLAHIDATHRCALLDLPDGRRPPKCSGRSRSALGVTRRALRGALAPTITTRRDGCARVERRAVQRRAGGHDRARDVLGNPNQPAAGINGVSRLALGLSQTYTDDVRETLNEAGVTLAKVIYGDVRTYGGRTVAGPDDEQLAVVRQLARRDGGRARGRRDRAELRAPADRRSPAAVRAFETELRAMLLRYFNAGRAVRRDARPRRSRRHRAEVNTTRRSLRAKCTP
jgi:hypothetical protein